MAPDRIGIWWREDIQQQSDNLPTELEKKSESDLSPPHYQSLKWRAIHLEMKESKCNRTEDVTQDSLWA